jgi:hypothetical protein
LFHHLIKESVTELDGEKYIMGKQICRLVLVHPWSYLTFKTNHVLDLVKEYIYMILYISLSLVVSKIYGIDQVNERRKEGNSPAKLENGIKDRNG